MSVAERVGRKAIDPDAWEDAVAHGRGLSVDERPSLIARFAASAPGPVESP